MAIRTIIITATRSGTPATIVINRGPTGPTGLEGEGAAYLDDVEAAETVVSPGDTDRWGWIQTVVGVPTLRKITGLGLKNWLKTYFDAIYTTVSAVATQIDTAITAIGLGNASTRNVGTTAGTVAAGDDSRVVLGGTAVQPSTNATLTKLTIPYADLSRPIVAGSGASGFAFLTRAGHNWVLENGQSNTILIGRTGSVAVAQLLTLASGGDPYVPNCGISATASAEIEINTGTAGSRANLTARDLVSVRYLRPASYTVAAANALSGVPEGAHIYVSNESGGACLAYYRSGWKRVSDNAAIS